MIALHSRVTTPNGSGYVQGRIVHKDDELILVSHTPQVLVNHGIIIAPYKGGVWCLVAYPAEQVQED